MIIDISSHSNPRIKQLKSLEKSRNRKSQGVFLMEGRPELDHAFALGLKAETVIFCEAYIAQDAVVTILSNQKPELLRLSKNLFDELSYQNTPNNFMAIFKSWEVGFADLNPQEPILVLENVEKPGNLGAILRSCDAAGLKQIIVCESEIDLFNPNVIRNSRGAIFGTKCVFTTNDSALSYLKENHYSLYAAALRPMSKDYRKFDYPKKTALLFGSESDGLSEFWLNQADEHIIIPMRGIGDSLNVSVSVGIIVYELINQLSK